jgi:hypothetical protein
MTVCAPASAVQAICAVFMRLLKQKPMRKRMNTAYTLFNHRWNCLREKVIHLADAFTGADLAMHGEPHR